MATEAGALPASEPVVLDSSDSIAMRADDPHVAGVDRHRLVDDAALLHLRRSIVLHLLVRLRMSLGHVDAGDDDRQRPARSLPPVTGAAVLPDGVADHAIDFAALAGIFAVHHDDGVALADLRHLVGRGDLL